MLGQIFNQEQMEILNHLINEKNDMSILNGFDAREMSDEKKTFFIEKGIIDGEGNLCDDKKEVFKILSHPEALVKIMFSGGVNKYEHTISYDKALQNYISYTVLQDSYTLNNETTIEEILSLIEDFIGKSSLKSINIYQKFNVQEAIVIASMLDLERRTVLRAFADELSYSNNGHSFNMIWRMVHSSNSSIQWLVYCFSEVIGEHLTLKQDQLKAVLGQLVDKKLIYENAGQYHLSDSMCQLANRMIVIDNILAIETIGSAKDDKRTGSGFTCLQASIHDLLIVDYDGRDVLIETISSSSLLDNIHGFLKAEAFRNND